MERLKPALNITLACMALLLSVNVKAANDLSSLNASPDMTIECSYIDNSKYSAPVPVHKSVKLFADGDFGIYNGQVFGYSESHIPSANSKSSAVYVEYLAPESSNSQNKGFIFTASCREADGPSHYFKTTPIDQLGDASNPTLIGIPSSEVCGYVSEVKCWMP